MDSDSGGTINSYAFLMSQTLEWVRFFFCLIVVLFKFLAFPFVDFRPPFPYHEGVFGAFVPTPCSLFCAAYHCSGSYRSITDKKKLSLATEAHSSVYCTGANPPPMFCHDGSLLFCKDWFCVFADLIFERYSAFYLMCSLILNVYHRFLCLEEPSRRCSQSLKDGRKVCFIF